MGWNPVRMATAKIQVGNDSPWYRSFTLQKEIHASVMSAIYSEAMLVSMLFLHAQHFGRLFPFSVSFMAEKFCEMFRKTAIKVILTQAFSQTGRVV